MKVKSQNLEFFLIKKICFLHVLFLLFILNFEEYNMKILLLKFFENLYIYPLRSIL